MERMRCFARALQPGVDHRNRFVSPFEEIERGFAEIAAAAVIGPDSRIER